MQYLKYLTHKSLLLSCLYLVSACGGGSDGSDESKVTAMQSVETLDPINTTEQAPTAEIEPNLPTTTTVPVTVRETFVNLEGTITYDRVLFNPRQYKGLDYDATTIMPARGVTVQLLGSNGTSIKTTKTDASGDYQFAVEKNADVRIRVVAELDNNSTASWFIQVRDNTNNNALYVLDGSLVSTGTNSTQTRNLHAESGWDGDDYNQARSSAPFAILDSVYDAISNLVLADSAIFLPPLNVYWSENNISVNGNLNEGKIGTSFYTSAGPSIYLLGAKNNDSDEFDRGVIQHEFGHYIEHQLSRTESIGGSHNISSVLDLRVAFGEAWGNAFSAMASGDPLYRDSLGAKQDLGFTIDVQARTYGLQGWFSEGSIQSILYNLFDDTNDQSDTLSLGFKPILDVLTSDAYLEHPGFASIYPFIEVLKQQNPDKASQIQQLLNSYNIYGTGFYGDNESNSAGSSITLPVYRNLEIGQTLNVCSDNDFQNYNGVDTYRLIKINLSQTRSYNIRATKASSLLASTNPQIRIHQNGNQIANLSSSTRDTEDGNRILSAGTYIIEVFEQSNAETINNSGGLACFNVIVN